MCWLHTTCRQASAEDSLLQEVIIPWQKSSVGSAFGTTFYECDKNARIMLTMDQLQAARLLNRVLRHGHLQAAENQDISEEKAKDILSFCSPDLLQLCMEQLAQQEDYEHCILLRNLMTDNWAYTAMPVNR